MTATWTTATRVQSRFVGAGTTSITTTQIEDYIQQAEGYFTTLMKSYGQFGIGGGTFDATKHAILTKVATAYAILCAVTSATISFQSLDDMYAVADLAYMEFIGCLSDLQTQDIVAYLKRI